MVSDRITSNLQASEIGHELGKSQYQQLVPELRTSLIVAQQRLKSANFPVIVVIAGDDRPGSDDAINTLNAWFDPRFLVTNAFDVPTVEERERPRFWRYWRALPPKGQVAVYSGGWPTQILREHLQGRLNEKEFLRASRHARRFEEMLVDDGAVVVKLWLHIAKRDLKSRLEAAEKHPDRHWRVDETDWWILKNYRRAMQVVESFLETTSEGTVPWDIVESSCDRFRDVTIAQRVLEAVQRGFDQSQAEANGTTQSDTPEARIGSHVDSAGSPGALANQLNSHTVLDTIDLDVRLDKQVYESELTQCQARLRRASQQMREEQRSAVFVFEGWDAGGKGGAIRRVAAAMNAHMYRIIPIAKPTDEEASRHYLWRFWRWLPRSGRVTIFDRSWYGRVLVERVEGFATERAWRRAYAEINDFEEQITEHGTRLVKFWLHISPEEQERRFREREKVPYKQFKITAEDYRNRELWHEYEHAADEMIARTSAPSTPWNLIAGNDKRWARIQVLKAICEALEA